MALQDRRERFPSSSLLDVYRNPLVLGPIGARASEVLPALAIRWKAMLHIPLEHAAPLISTGVSLAILLSIDTLKTSLMLDTMTHHRHNSNKELRAQGFGNLVDSVILFSNIVTCLAQQYFQLEKDKVLFISSNELAKGGSTYFLYITVRILLIGN